MKDGKKVAIGLGLAGAGAFILTKVVKAKPPIPEVDIALSDLVIIPSEVDVGELVTIRVSVTNIGETAGSYPIVRDVEGDIITFTVTLEPGEVKVVHFTYKPMIAKYYSVTVDGLSGTFLAIERETMCVGYDLYTLYDGEWILTEESSEFCGYVSPPPPPLMIEEQLASIMPYLERVAWYDEQTGEWLLYSPGAPSDLLSLTEGYEYHIRVSAACTIIYISIHISLAKGVNTIIWQGVPAPPPEEPPPGTAAFSGDVFGYALGRDPWPLAGAIVNVGGIWEDISDAEGHFHIEGIEPGTYTITCTPPGYRSKKINTSFTPGESKSYDFGFSDWYKL